MRDEETSQIHFFPSLPAKLRLKSVYRLALFATIKKQIPLKTDKLLY